MGNAPGILPTLVFDFITCFYVIRVLDSDGICPGSGFSGRLSACLAIACANAPWHPFPWPSNTMVISLRNVLRVSRATFDCENPCTFELQARSGEWSPTGAPSRSSLVIKIISCNSKVGVAIRSLRAVQELRQAIAPKIFPKNLTIS